MAGIDNKLFTLMVVSNEPEKVIEKYNANRNVEPYIRYYYKDSGKYRKKAIKIAEELVENADKFSLSAFMKDYFKDKVSVIKRMSDFEYYTSLCENYSFDEDGNALTMENPDGKWSTCSIGKNLCIPLKFKDGSEAFQARSGEIDWSAMHMTNTEVYRTAWQLFHGEREPVTDDEKTIYENIKGQDRYFSGFDCEDDYVTYSCSYWCYAYADDNGWEDADNYKDYKWITGFYKKFVEKLPDDALVTIYECMRPVQD